MIGNKLRRPVRDGVVDPQRQAEFAAQGRLRRQAMGMTPAAPMPAYNAAGQRIAPISGQGPVEVRPLSSAPASANPPEQGPRTNWMKGVPLMQFERHQMNGIQQNLPPADAMGLREQALQQEGRRLDAQFQMAQRNQQERAKYYGKSGNAAGMQHVGLRPPQEDSGYMVGLGAEADMASGRQSRAAAFAQAQGQAGAPPQSMASIPPEQMTTFNRGQMRQPGVYDPGYGQFQPAPGIAPMGQGPIYGQESYQGIEAAPKNAYGLRRTPAQGRDPRQPGDANLDPVAGAPPKAGMLGTYGLNPDGTPMGPGRGAELIRDPNGRQRLVGINTPEKQAYYDALKEKRMAAGTAKRQAFLTDRANFIDQRREKRGLSPLRVKPSDESLAAVVPQNKPLTPREKKSLLDPKVQDQVSPVLGYSPATATPTEVYDRTMAAMESLDPADKDYAKKRQAIVQGAEAARSREGFDVGIVGGYEETSAIDEFLKNPDAYMQGRAKIAAENKRDRLARPDTPDSKYPPRMR